MVEYASEAQFRDAHHAMQIVEQYGFRLILSFCDPHDELFVVGRYRRGECYEIIRFQGVRARAVRAHESGAGLVLPDDAGLEHVATGFALDVVKKLLALSDGDVGRHDDCRDCEKAMSRAAVCR